MTFHEFYGFYLGEHAHPANRRMHFLGTFGALICVVASIVTANPWLVPAGAAFGYACAWYGHFRFERNKPATFRHPFYSLLADWVMFKDILTGRVSLRR